MTVGDWMSKNVKMVAPTTSVEAAARQMMRAGVHRILVGEQGSIAGIVSSMDIVRLAAGYARAEQPEAEAIS
ncbi:CBS domain protein [compost metagenome]